MVYPSDAIGCDKLLLHIQCLPIMSFYYFVLTNFANQTTMSNGIRVNVQDEDSIKSLIHGRVLESLG